MLKHNKTKKLRRLASETVRNLRSAELRQICETIGKELLCATPAKLSAAADSTA
jgi:hypothetical protein